jgi:chromate transporter
MDRAPAITHDELPDGEPQVGLLDLFRVFAVIGVSSFGGGLSGWIFRELVENRRWISNYDFLAGLSLARTMPGPNVVNLSIWIGHRLRGKLGAVVAAASVLAGPAVMIIVFASLYRGLGGSPLARRILLGVAAASLGISMSLGVKTFRLAARTPAYALVVGFTFFGVGVMRWPMLPVVAVAAPISIGWACWFEAGDEG